MRLQGVPFNPAEQSAVAPDLAFNTAVSFVTNTNWQNYGGESTMSYLVQMLGLTHQNFLSAATDMKQQHGDRVGQPVLLARRVDAAIAVEQRLYRLQRRRQECALAIEDTRHVAAERLHQSDDDRAVEEDLDPADEAHEGTFLEPLGSQQGIGQIDEQHRGHDAAEHVFDEHGDTPQRWSQPNA